MLLGQDQRKHCPFARDSLELDAISTLSGRSTLRFWSSDCSPGDIPKAQALHVITEAHQEHPELSVQLLQVNRSWYDHRPTEAEMSEDEVLVRDAIEQLIVEFAGYGYRRVTKALQRTGWQINHKRVLRIMREESLLCHLKWHFVPTTDAHHCYQTYPNLLKQTAVTAPDQVWIADITYIRLPTCFVAPFCPLG
jgi:putative transposase